MQAVSQPLPVVPGHRVRRGRRRTTRSRRLLAIIILAAALVLPRVVATWASGPEAPGVAHVVAPGETLWDIADQYTEGRDLRKVVATIQQRNGLKTAVIQPGQVLEIPASLME